MKNKFYTISVTLLIILGSLSVHMVFSYIDIQNLTREIPTFKEQQLNNIWTDLELLIDKYYDIAIDQSNAIKKEFLQGVAKGYTDKEEIAKDLAKVNTGELTKLMFIMDKVVRDKYIVDMPNCRNANDSHVLTDYIVFVDGSSDCAKEDNAPRVFKEELPAHFSPKLGEQAFEDITVKKLNKTFWNYAPVDKIYSWHEDIKNLESTNLDALHGLFLKYADLRIFNTIEFLGIVNIEDNFDLAGSLIIRENGTVNSDAYQLHIDTGFNLADIMMYREKNYDATKERISRIDEQLKQKERNLDIRYLGAGVELFVFLFAFIFLTRYGNKNFRD